MLIDEVTITVKGGNGGNGAISFRQNEGNPKGGPDGGNGGNGGAVYAIGIDDMTALSQFQYKKLLQAEDGVPGKKKNLFGKNAPDLYLKLPLGTLITDERTEKVLAEIADTTTPVLLAIGGKGGRGNNEFKSATVQTPRFAEKGQPGEEKVLHLQMRLIADVGLVGLPNAGKSTLLSLLTNATPKVGDYPFTTLEPNLGMMDGFVLADIPGLIEGASSGKGLGIKFLKHIEKTRLLVHCIDAFEEDVLKTYEIVRQEFGTYNDSLLKKEEIILLTKCDLVDRETVEAKKLTLEKTGSPVFAITAYADEEVARFREGLLELLQKESPTSAATTTKSAS